MDFDCYSRDGRTAPIFLLQKRRKIMNNTRKIAYAGLLAALYVALTYAQNFQLPGTTSMAIQFRASEALTVMAFYSPSAICA